MTTPPRGNSTADTHHVHSAEQNGESGGLAQICARVHAQITAFIDADATTDRLRRVQEQTRLTLRILDESLERYR